MDVHFLTVVSTNGFCMHLNVYVLYQLVSQSQHSSNITYKMGSSTFALLTSVLLCYSVVCVSCVCHRDVADSD